MSVTMTASANATPASGTIVAAHTINSQEHQVVHLGDASGSLLGTAGSPLHTVLTNSAAGSPQFVSLVAGSAAGSPIYVSACITNRSGSAAGSPLFSSITNLAGSAAGSPLFVSQNNMAGSAAGSPIFSSITNLAGSAAGSPLFTSVTNLAGSAAGSPLFVTAAQGASGACPWGVRILDAAGLAYGVSAGSPLFVSGGAGGTNATDQAAYAVGTTSFTPVGGFFSANPVALTACLSGAVRMSAQRGLHANLRDSSGNELGTGVASPLIVQIGDGIDFAVIDAASRFLTAACVVNTASVIINSGSVVVTNALSASISNVASVIVSSGSVVVTNGLSASISGGSVALLAGANVFGSASVIQSTGAGITVPWTVKLTDSVDSAMIDSASRQHTVLSDGTNAYGIPASPLSQTGEAQKIWWGGSLLTLNQINMSSSTSGCTRIVASTSGQAIVVVAATFTTSSCQFIGWIASGAGAASAAVQTAMPFGTNGGMDANRMPHGWLWNFPSGSNAIVTTTSACNVAGTIQYLNVAS